MKAVVNTAPGTIQFRDWPTPQPTRGQVRIRVAACGVCATDLQMIEGWKRTRCPSIPGHEWSGVVEALGPGVSGTMLGRRCVAENILADGGEVGFEHAGGYGEFLVTDARNLHVVPDDFPMDQAALIEPLAVCVRGLRRLRLEDRSGALIFGDGPIGLILGMLLRQRGVTHLAMVGGRTSRLLLARQIGVNTTADYHQAPDIASALAAAGAPALFPVVVDATGSVDAVTMAMRLLQQQGTLLLLGDYGDGRSHLAWNHFLHNEWEFIGSNASAGAWPEAVRLAVSRQLPLERLITHRFPARQALQALDAARKNRDVVKVVLDWGVC